MVQVQLLHHFIHRKWLCCYCIHRYVVLVTVSERSLPIPIFSSSLSLPSNTQHCSIETPDARIILITEMAPVETEYYDLVRSTPRSLLPALTVSG
jgi:hypothetical protein